MLLPPRPRLVLLLLLAAAAPLSAAPVLDDQVKAAVIYKVMLFTHWQAPAQPDAALSLCVMGQDEVGSALPELQGRMIGARPLKVRSLGGRASFEGCDALYFAGPERHRLPSLLAQVPIEGLMTVVDCGVGLCASGAVLSLGVEDGRLVFALDRAQAERQGLAFSAQVLRLAQPVASP
ncbi:MAG: YfiR family protein [Stagnimonas sp.]|nr:YfiR family protein [Stagnimonas sp.]